MSAPDEIIINAEDPPQPNEFDINTYHNVNATAIEPHAILVADDLLLDPTFAYETATTNAEEQQVHRLVVIDATCGYEIVTNEQEQQVVTVVVAAEDLFETNEQEIQRVASVENLVEVDAPYRYAVDTNNEEQQMLTVSYEPDRSGNQTETNDGEHMVLVTEDLEQGATYGYVIETNYEEEEMQTMAVVEDPDLDPSCGYDTETIVGEQEGHTEVTEDLEQSASFGYVTETNDEDMHTAIDEDPEMDETCGYGTDLNVEERDGHAVGVTKELEQDSTFGYVIVTNDGEEEMQTMAIVGDLGGDQDGHTIVVANDLELDTTCEYELETNNAEQQVVSYDDLIVQEASEDNVDNDDNDLKLNATSEYEQETNNAEQKVLTYDDVIVQEAPADTVDKDVPCISSPNPKIVIENGIKIFVCPDAGCTRKYRSSKSLKTHRRTHTNADLPYKCETCARCFNSSNTLKTHIRTHTGERPYVCSEPNCGKSFKTWSVLRNHSVTHSDDPRPFLCTRCPQRFANCRNLVDHERRHTGERPFQCRQPNCERRFGNMTNRKNHERVHTAEKVHKCAQCSRTFTEYSTLHKHRLVHAERPLTRPEFACDACPKAYRRAQSLQRHIRSAHSTDLDVFAASADDDEGRDDDDEDVDEL